MTLNILSGRKFTIQIVSYHNHVAPFPLSTQVIAVHLLFLPVPLILYAQVYLFVPQTLCPVLSEILALPQPQQPKKRKPGFNSKAICITDDHIVKDKADEKCRRKRKKKQRKLKRGKRKNRRENRKKRARTEEERARTEEERARTEERPSAEKKRKLIKKEKRRQIKKTKRTETGRKIAVVKVRLNVRSVGLHMERVRMYGYAVTCVTHGIM